MPTAEAPQRRQAGSYSSFGDSGDGPFIESSRAHLAFEASGLTREKRVDALIAGDRGGLVSCSGGTGDDIQFITLEVSPGVRRLHLLLAVRTALRIDYTFRPPAPGAAPAGG